MNNDVIGILGSNGKLGRKLINLFKKNKYNIKCATLNKSTYLEENGIEYQNFDVSNKREFDKFCKNISLLIGTAGPSRELSQLMYNMATAKGVAYIDPLGEELENSRRINKTSITGCGLMPGFTGFVLGSILNLIDKDDLEIEMVSGGNYSFSKSSKNEINSIKANLENSGFMKSIEDKKIKFTSILKPQFINIDKFNTVIPYLTKEIIDMLSNFRIKTMHNFIVMPNQNIEQKNDTFKLNLVIHTNNVPLRAVRLKILDPDYFAAYIIYTCSKNILKQKERNYGLISASQYMLKENINIREITDNIPWIMEKEVNIYG